MLPNQTLHLPASCCCCCCCLCCADIHVSLSVHALIQNMSRQEVHRRGWLPPSCPCSRYLQVTHLLHNGLICWGHRLPLPVQCTMEASWKVDTILKNSVASDCSSITSHELHQQIQCVMLTVLLIRSMLQPEAKHILKQWCRPTTLGVAVGLLQQSGKRAGGA